MFCAVEPNQNSLDTMSQTDTSKRSKNFYDSEVMVLLGLVEQYKEILLSKKTDNASAQEKRRVWKSIEQEFNNTPGMVYFRDSKTLQNKYKNLKKISKTGLSTDQRDITGTMEQIHHPYKWSFNPINGKPKELLGEVDQGQERSTILYVEDNSGNQELDSTKSSESSSSVNFNSTSLPVAVKEEIIQFPDHHLAMYNKQNSPSQIDPDVAHNSPDTDMHHLNPVTDMVDVTLEDSRSSGTTSCGTFRVESSLMNSVNTSTLPERNLISFCVSCRAKVNNLQHNIGSLNKSQSSSWGDKSRFSSSSPNMGKRKTTLKTFPGTRVGSQSNKQDVLKLQRRVLHKQLLYQEEEHKLKLKCMQEKHDLEIKLLKLKVQNEEFIVEKHMREALKETSSV